MGLTEINQITEKIIGAAIEVHKALGPGLLESIYERCLCHELALQDINYQVQMPLPLKYKGLDLGKDFRIDLMVMDTVIVEIKAVESILPVHEAQLLSYMKLTEKKVGLLLDFNVPYLKNGIHRKILT